MSRFVDEFDKSKSMSEASIGSYYFSKVMNNLERHLILPTTVASNTKFLNSLQPEWKKLVTMVRQLMNIHESYDFQAEAISDDPVKNLNTSMMMLARAISLQYLTPTNNRLRVSSNTRNQAYVQCDWIDVQCKNTRNVRYAGNAGRNTRRIAGNLRITANTSLVS
nr:hypothetical protein [Tanacetum cinerariifolium]